MDGVNTGIPAKRLIVLLPVCMVNHAGLSRAIYRMAFVNHLSVLYLILLGEGEDELAVARSAETMRAVTAANSLLVDTKQIRTCGWVETLYALVKPGDIVVCQKEQIVQTGILRMLPIEDLLSNRLDTPLLTLSGFYPSPPVFERPWFQTVVTWAGFLAILAVGAWLGIKLDQAFEGLLEKFMLMLSFSAELGVIWAWFKFNCL